MFDYLEKTPSEPAVFSLENFHSGRCAHAWRYFGAHPARDEAGREGCLFRVWAPNARAVSVTGDFNVWVSGAHPMTCGEGGVWECFLPGLKACDRYRFAIEGADGAVVQHADPYAFHADLRPNTASRIWDTRDGYVWGDQPWMDFRASLTAPDSPMNVYECHLGSWRRTGEGHFLDYRTVAHWLVPYIKEMGYTHVELLPITEHPLDESWGYQCTGFFAPTSRFGTPEDLKYLVDQLHQAGIGVILDWTPAHFPRDEFALGRFDGTPLYEYADPQRADHPDWGTLCFDLGKGAVRSFLLSSAMFWLEEFHMDGLRVDAVSSMLYLDYSRKSGEWTPNIHGGNENLEAIDFLRALNTAVRAAHPDVLMIAEESTAWPGVTAPVSRGGLGFHYKWNMGWMNDTCHYMALPIEQRPFHHRDLTFPLMFAFHEHYILPISHDEVTYQKASYLSKSPGDDLQKFAAVRTFYAHMMTQPGKKLSFMGCEFGQWQEWKHQYSLDWHLLEYDRHRQLAHYFKTVNAYYLSHPCLWEQDTSWEGYRWLSVNDRKACTVVYLRRSAGGKCLLVACNFSGDHHHTYRVGLPFGSTWAPDFSTDAWEFGGAGRGNTAPIKTEAVPFGGQTQSLVLDLPPLSCTVYRCVRKYPHHNPRSLRKPRKNAPPRKAE